jgi:hypothetical protein
VSGQVPEVVGGLKQAEGVELLGTEQVDDGELNGGEGKRKGRREWWERRAGGGGGLGAGQREKEGNGGMGGETVD